MVYLANALINPNLAFKAYTELIEKDLEVYIPNETIKYEGREININAFEQLRKRSPTNPYIIELKKQIIKELIDHIVISPNVIVCNDMDEVFNDQTMFEVAISWYLNKSIYSYNDIQSSNRELCSAIGIISLKGNIINFNVDRKEDKKEVLKVPEKTGGRYKLTIKDEG